eukprot:TRINITY_DN2326_c0_g1_i1.p1 TRINITY_DN2326_c0_g1~~TRINITY_DN2326_c0_g1_i1.p1  ORF type:complete len:105 (-),score=24.66 TRINITY_DN2326_c0_g1_i1:112-426(-)
MSGHADPSLAAKLRFKTHWMGVGAIPMQSVFVAGTVAVAYIAYHHFWKNNTTIVNKNNPRQFFEVDAEKIVDPQWRRNNSPYREFYDYNKKKILNPYDNVGSFH